MAEKTNTERADMAFKALSFYCGLTNQGDDIDPGLTDILTDLMHLCHQEQEDFDEFLRRARMHFKDESE